MLKEYNIEDLSPGMMVAKIINQSGPVKIKKVGMIRSEDMIKGLKEMKVERVLVDLEQSFGVEVQEALTTNQQDRIGQFRTTNSQYLVSNQAEISKAERKLSQNFHRSLFMPTVDDMPSKWQLYGKPYFTTFSLISIGFLLGFFSFSKGPDAYGMVVSFLQKDSTQTQKVEVTQAHHSDTQQNAETTKTSTDESAQAVLINQTSTELNSSNVSDQLLSQTLALDPKVEKDNPVSSQQDIEQTNDQQLVMMNGVLVEDGQTILGYQAQPAQNQNLRDELLTPSENDDEQTLSTDLYERVQQAAQLVDTQLQTEPSTQELVKVTDLNAPPPIHELPVNMLTRIPSMNFSAHMYASNEQDRWVSVNDRRVYEGQLIATNLRLIEIQPERVVLSFEGEEFSMPSLTDW